VLAQLKAPDRLNGLLEDLAKVQERAGDNRGAMLTRAQISAPPSPAVAEWLEFATTQRADVDWSKTIDLRLAEIAARPAYASYALTAFAKALASKLLRMEMLERKFALVVAN